jgi:DNA-binding transcriptional MerR regulator
VPDELVAIGTFSMVTGLSISTLRHHDDIGLLTPAEVDPRTGYRRYSSVQVDLARRIHLLRSAELSTEDIGRVIGGEVGDARDVLARQRAVLRDRTERVDALLEQLAQDGSVQMKSAADFRLVAVNVGVDSESALEVACASWGEVLGSAR